MLLIIMNIKQIENKKYSLIIMFSSFYNRKLSYSWKILSFYNNLNDQIIQSLIKENLYIS